METQYRARFADAALADLMVELPAVLLTGPRGCGKTTTAGRHAGSFIGLDVPATAAALSADPDEYLIDRPGPVLVDEWQAVPDVLGAIKRRVDADPAPGQFILTGSVRSQTSSQMWPGTGRLVRLAMGPMSEREIEGFTGPLDELPLHRMLAGRPPVRHRSTLGIRDYIQRSERGGFPEAVRLTRPQLRRRWLSSYVEQLLTRDIADLDESVNEDRLATYVQVLALNLAGVLAQSSLTQMAGANVRTTERYDRLLAEVGLVHNLPAWGINRIERIEKRPKRFLTDSGLACVAAGLDARSILDDGVLLGRFLEAHVLMQLRAEALAAHEQMRLHHLRTLNGRQEIDFVVEGQGGRLVAIEVKAGATVTPYDARHLAWLKERVGSRFMAGIVLHTGPDTFPLGDTIWAMPISMLWAVEQHDEGGAPGQD